MKKTTWKKLISEIMEREGETFSDVISSTLTPAQLGKRFYNCYGEANAPAFRLWTEKRVYFSRDDDGKVSVGCVERNPGGERPYHL